jgi:hypothetical protein
MIYVGIDVGRRRHSCFIISSEGVVLYSDFPFPNTEEGFELLHEKVLDSAKRAGDQNVKTAISTAGLHSGDIETFLLSKGLKPVPLDPAAYDLFREAQALPETKTFEAGHSLFVKMLVTELAKPCGIGKSGHCELFFLEGMRSALAKDREGRKAALASAASGQDKETSELRNDPVMVDILDAQVAIYDRRAKRYADKNGCRFCLCREDLENGFDPLTDQPAGKAFNQCFPRAGVKGKTDRKEQSDGG